MSKAIRVVQSVDGSRRAERNWQIRSERNVVKATGEKDADQSGVIILERRK